jgi:hypothetical protein
MISMSGGAWSYNRFEAYEKQLAEKKADEDYDGDGKVESSKDEYFGSKDKAIKKAMGKDTKKESKDDDCECKEAYEVTNADKKGNTPAYQGYKAGKKGKDGKPMYKKGPGLTEGSCGGYQEGGEVKAKKKKVVKEDVLEYMMENQLAINEVSAEVLFNHISDEFLESIEDDIMEGWKPLPREKMDRQAGKAYQKEQQAAAKGDASEANKQMQRRNAMQMPQGRKDQLTRKNAPMNKFKSA